ncbi:MAG: ribosomal-protein-alanine N-acetyltransferase [bacterium ADurb.Bin429]|nr:MAG: ribosomal-protein-alanine N-acetyltransferase [bacterium ADurb.Bin429]
MLPSDQTRFPAIEAVLKNDETVNLRPLTTADGEALAEFYANIPREAIRFYGPYPLDREHALLNASRADSPTEVVLAAETSESRIAGYAWYRWNEGAPTSVFGICIRPAYQEQRLGRALMTRLLAIAREIGPPVMSLTVQLANTRAVTLYTSMGFTPLREQTRQADPTRGFAEEPEYYMELKIER